MRPGDVLAGRYRLLVLLHERSEGRFWRAFDTVLARHVALHLIPVDDPRAPGLQDAARLSATVQDPRLLRVLDTNTLDGLCYVVNEWGEGVSLNNMVADEPLAPLRAAWIVAEAATMVAAGHAAGVAHGRLVPENVLLDTSGSVKVIGFAVDAALHGLPAGRIHSDVVDLGGLLYAALTGRWTGVSQSGVPAAPIEHGRPLRARQVRAGVPRVLDGICEDLLGGGSRFHTAQDVVDALLDYIGDPSVVAQAEARRAHEAAGGTHHEETGDLPAVDDQPTQTISAVAATGSPAAEAADPIADPVAAPTAHPTGGLDDGPATEIVPAIDDDATEAGNPVLEEEDWSDWTAARAEQPPPPPPFDDVPERPLFAPDPPEGRLRRLPPPTSDSGFWPFAAEETVHGVIPEPEEPTPQPGRGWLRVAGVLLAVLLVALLVVALLSRIDGGGDGPDTSDSPTAATPLAGLTADDFDPFDDAREEHPAEVARAVDADATSAWTTSTYDQDFGAEGLKPGVGLVLDLGTDHTVSRVVVTVAGDPVEADLRTADSRPSSLDATSTVAQGTSAGGTLELTPDEAVETRYLVLWLTGLPQVSGGFRGAVADIKVFG